MLKDGRYETLRAKVEKIVRDDGDMTLDIDYFIAKMMSEIEINERSETPHDLKVTVERVSRFNGIPEDIVMELWKIHKEKESSFGIER